MKKQLGIFIALLLALVMTFGLGLPVAANGPIDPPLVQEDVAPGDSITVTKTVMTPVIPPKPDIYFLADTTGSMGPAIANVQLNAAAILAAVAAVQPDAQFGVGDYKDFPPGTSNPYAFLAAEAITDDTTAVQNAINAWSTAPGQGGDGPEGQFYALTEIATDPAIGWRTGSSKIVVWFGDAPGHDPVPNAATGLGYDITETTVTDALAAADITVIAISLTSGDYPAAGLDDDPNLYGPGDYAATYGIIEDGSPGQATRITTATGGLLLTTGDPNAVSAAILEGLTNLRTDVWPTVVADPALTVTFEPPVIYNVLSGSTVQFVETITLAEDAPQCNTLYATVTFWANSHPRTGEAIGTQEIEIHVLDIEAPVVSCEESVNPHGKNVPPAGSTTEPGTNPKSGKNPDGFYELHANDNCDDSGDVEIYISGFGPFFDGDVVKLTEDPDILAPEMKMMGSSNGQAGAVVAHIIVPTEPMCWGVDTSGNQSEPHPCYVPPPPK